MIQRHGMLNAQEFLSSSAFLPTAQIFSQPRTCSCASQISFTKHELWSKIDSYHSNKGARSQLAACEFAPGFSFAFIWIYAYFEAEPSAFHLFITSRGALATILLRWEIMSPLDFSFMMPSWAEEQLMSPESNSRGGRTPREKLISASVAGLRKAHQDQTALLYVLSVCWRARASMLLSITLKVYYNSVCFSQALVILSVGSFH